MTPYDCAARASKGGEDVVRNSEIQTVISKVPQTTLDVKSNKNIEYLKVKTLEDTLNTKQLNNEKEIKELEEKLKL